MSGEWSYLLIDSSINQASHSASSPFGTGDCVMESPYMRLKCCAVDFRNLGISTGLIKYRWTKAHSDSGHEQNINVVEFALSFVQSNEKVDGEGLHGS